MTFSKADTARFLFKADGKEFSVSSFFVKEAISEPYEVHVALISEDKIEPGDMLRKEALLTVLDDDEKSNRYFHGIALEFALEGILDNSYVYRARVAPHLKLLAFKANNRIFQDKKTEEIVRQVLEEIGMTSSDFQFRLSGAYEKRPYCVQNRETDLHFVSRLLAEDGVFYFFEHSDKNHLLVFGNAANYNDIAGTSPVVFNADVSMVTDEDQVKLFGASLRIRSGQATLSDFNYEKPSLNLTARKKGDKTPDLEVYDYPGLYAEKGLGEKIAKTRLDSLTALKNTARGESVCQRFAPGLTFELKEHSLSELSKKYVLTEASHIGRQTQSFKELADEAPFVYENRFDCLPDSVAPIPPLMAKPRAVLQTAFVVGPEEEEIYTDELGRVKVQFHWDREGKKDEKSSCWLRVAQAWAGVQWGAAFLPRVGHEVLVNFIDGDPDRPIVSGSVYNALNVPPYKLPDNKTVSGIKSRSTPKGDGFNEIKFEDKKNEEEIFIHAQKDQNEIVENCLSREVKNNQTLIVGMNRTATVLEKNDSLKIEKGDRIVEVTEGKELLTVKKGTRAVEVKGDEVHKNDADYIRKTGGKYTLKVSGAITIEAGGEMTIKAAKVGLN